MTSPDCQGAVLVVDDDVDIVETLIEVLGDNDFRAVGAKNGADALAKLRADIEEPCLILLDLMMPVMDGFGFRAAQREDERLAQIPVVVLSAHADVEAAARELSANGFMQKPVKLARLLEFVKRFCKRTGTC